MCASFSFRFTVSNFLVSFTCEIISRELTLLRFHETPYELIDYMELVKSETSTTSAEPVLKDPGFVEK